MRTLFPLSAALLLALSLFTPAFADPPPFDDDVLAGDRPTFDSIDLDDIPRLAEDPVGEADLVRFRFDPGDLTADHRDILTAWLKSGHGRLLLRGVDLAVYADLLGLGFGYIKQTASEDDFEPRSLRLDDDAPTSAECTDVTTPADIKDGPKTGTTVRIGGFGISVPVGVETRRWIYLKPPRSSAGFIPLAEYGSRQIAAARIMVGKTKVYFLPAGPFKGDDRVRWSLNVWSWILGRAVPGAPDAPTTEADTVPLPEVEPEPVAEADASPPDGVPDDGLDRLFFRNGDRLSGLVLDGAFALKTAYASLELKTNDVREILFRPEPDAGDVLVMKSSDRFTGDLRNDRINFRLVTEAEIAIPVGLLERITFGGAPGDGEALSDDAPVLFTDPEGPHTVALGRSFTISLPRTDDLGYRWKGYRLSDDDLVRLGDVSYRVATDEESLTLLGSHGSDQFTFETLALGAVSITFEYKRAWERAGVGKRTTFLVTISK